MRTNCIFDTDPLSLHREKLHPDQSSLAGWVAGHNGRRRGDFRAIPSLCNPGSTQHRRIVNRRMTRSCSGKSPVSVRSRLFALFFFFVSLCQKSSRVQEVTENVAYVAKVCFIFGTWYGVWAFFSHLWMYLSQSKRTRPWNVYGVWFYRYTRSKCTRNLFVHGHMTDMA